MLILAFDTSGPGFSVALLRARFQTTHGKEEQLSASDEKILATKKIIQNGKQSELLILTIEEILKSQNIWYQDLNLIAATNGPGSFTGSRIGVTCAKTIAIACKLPLIFVSTLEVIAFTFGVDGKNFIALDCDNNELFIAEFFKEKKDLKQTLDTRVIKKEEFDWHLPKDKNLSIISKNISDLNAENIAFLAKEKFIKGDVITDKTAIYLRDPKIGKRKK